MLDGQSSVWAYGENVGRVSGSFRDLQVDCMRWN